MSTIQREVPAGIKVYTLEESPNSDSSISLFYGGAGSGKTWFLGSAGPRTFFINSGDGLETLRSPLFKQKYPESKGMIITDLNETIGQNADAFDKTCDIIDLAFSLTYIEKWDQLFIDDATAFNRFARNKAVELNAGLSQDAKRKERSLKREYVFTGVDDYGKEMQMIAWFLGTYIPQFKQHGKHLAITAHERHIFGKAPKIGEEQPLQKVKPGFTGKTFPDEIQGFFDDVWRFEVVGGGMQRVYRITTAGNEIYAAKSRHNGIFETIERGLDYPTMIQRIAKRELHSSYIKK